MAGAGMGCTLISRAALQAMIDGKVVEQRKDILDGAERLGWGFFDHLKVGDIPLSEDFSFCYRWTGLLGRELWVCVDEPITHLGEFPYRARYLDRMRPAPPPSQPSPANAHGGTAAEIEVAPEEAGP
jgi:hypothetical protein